MGEVVLVHGAWHGAWCWDGVLSELRQLGVPGRAVDLPLSGFAADVAAARAAIEAAGPGSVVVGHSYGGSVITEAAAGMPAVARLVYLAAFLTEPNEDTAALMAESTLPPALIVSETTVTVDPALAAAVFYADADAATAAALVARLRPMLITPPVPSETEPAWRFVPSTYVVCGNDRAIPAESQRKMARRADTVIEWPTDHSPFVTRPRAVAELVAGYAA